VSMFSACRAAELHASSFQGIAGEGDAQRCCRERDENGTLGKGANGKSVRRSDGRWLLPGRKVLAMWRCGALRCVRGDAWSVLLLGEVLGAGQRGRERCMCAASSSRGHRAVMLVRA
jgi:hypothetical protein